MPAASTSHPIRRRSPDGAPLNRSGRRVSAGGGLMAVPDESRCARCQRPNPERGEGGLPNEWEVIEDDAGEVVGVICPGCVTETEQQAIDEAMVELGEALSRCGRCRRA